MKYEPLPQFTKSEVLAILCGGSKEDKKIVSLSVGEYCDDCTFAQEVCAKLLSDEDAEVRAYAALGFGYIARNHPYLKRLDILPLLKKELAQNSQFNGIIEDAISDVNIFLK